MKKNHVPYFSPPLIKRPVAAGVITFLFFTALGFFILWQRFHLALKEEEQETSAISNLIEQNIEQSLAYSYAAALSLALQVDKDGNVSDFEEIAGPIVDNNPNIDAVQMVPGGVIKKVYPFEEHKDALNYNILQDPEVNKEAFKAIDTKKMYFAGPLELKQGGIAVIGRLPVFIKNEFWGFSAVIIYLDNLLEQSGIKHLGASKFAIQFGKVNPETGTETFFLPEIANMGNSYSEEITLPEGDWRIYVAPLNNHHILEAQFPIAILLFFVSVFLGWLAYLLARQPARLQVLLENQAKEMAKNELKFQTIFNQAAIGMAWVDSKTGRLLQSNKKLQEQLGYSNEELVNMEYSKISHPLDIQENKRLMAELSSNKRRGYSQQNRLAKKNGDYIWTKLTVSPLWETGEEPTTHIALVEDISARVQAQQKLKEKERRFRALVENSHDVILILNKEGQLTYFSPALKRITGYNDEELLQINVASLLHQDDLENIREQMKFIYHNPGIPCAGAVARAKTKNGKWLWAESTITNCIKEENINGFIINLRDITEKKEAEMHLKNSYQMLMEKNARLLNFSYIVSHNLRSHTTNLESLLHLYNTSCCEQERKTYMNLLFTVCNALNNSLYDLNDVVSIHTDLNLKVEELAVNTCLKKALEVLKSQIKSLNARVVVKVPEEMVVAFNAAYMESVLLNFLTNALRYRDTRRTPEMVVHGYLENSKWVLEISDNGIGIDMKKNSGKLFGLYKTFTKREGSRGIGLFMARNQIHAMGGEVTVKSKVGVGTTFKIMFK
ncbi:PAS domain S-box protein [Zunongwangia sp. H14]|uniref:PAS domain S-box protein n=1 Tax=Zunongwangia sp. H14 TaxID=3240792 RepID=UPI0035639674